MTEKHDDFQNFIFPKFKAKRNFRDHHVSANNNSIRPSTRLTTKESDYENKQMQG